ncbi:hypothetical protein [Pseudomonas sp. rhizo25]|uniref:hypothetical protein n=1 Tax=Pseudomonas sp. rhizo25 TaxID=3059675 RepID=UPI00288CC4C3|nr:hypothetical protein [Pseudomonas sp. rhizo25]MDT3230938.1 hypothetical protein [Pseudomonas sp. rhizo25]
MSHIKARIEALRMLVDELKNAATIFERASLFAAIRILVEDLDNDERLNSYAKEKANGVRWHCAAALGFDDTNGHTFEAHRGWAMGELSTLESAYK